MQGLDGIRLDYFFDLAALSCYCMQYVKAQALIFAMLVAQHVCGLDSSCTAYCLHCLKE